jgi:hypothetical protein
LILVVGRVGRAFCVDPAPVARIEKRFPRGRCPGATPLQTAILLGFFAFLDSHERSRGAVVLCRQAFVKL